MSENPYQAPSSEIPNDARSRSRFAGRSFIAILLACATAFTGLLTGGLWMLGAIDLGRYAILFLLSLAAASFILVYAANRYTAESRKFAVGLSAFALFVIGFAISMALYDAGMFTLF